MKNQFLFLILFLSVFFSFSQEKTKPILKPYKIGFAYNHGTNENFVFDDPDYTYSTNIFKAQAFYKLGKWKKIDFELIVQPQIQFIKHQLINEQFVTPNQKNYLLKRAEFTKSKKIHLYAIEFGFVAKKKLSEKLYFQGGISLGFSMIDKRSERLAKGFTFIENFSIGFTHQTFKNNLFYLGTNFGHVSNLNFQKPNDGYNNLGIEIGYSYFLE